MEANVLYGRSCSAPLLCRFGWGDGGWDWAVANEKTEIWEIPDHPKWIALRAALGRLGVTPNFNGVRDLVASRRIGQLLQAIG